MRLSKYIKIGLILIMVLSVILLVFLNQFLESDFIINEHDKRQKEENIRLTNNLMIISVIGFLVSLSILILSLKER